MTKLKKYIKHADDTPDNFFDEFYYFSYNRRIKNIKDEIICYNYKLFNCTRHGEYFLKEDEGKKFKVLSTIKMTIVNKEGFILKIINLVQIEVGDKKRISTFIAEEKILNEKIGVTFGKHILLEKVREFFM